MPLRCILALTFFLAAIYALPTSDETWEETSEAAADAPTFNSIGWVLSAYNIYMGNPHATFGGDPGLGVPIFQGTYNQQRTSTDRRFSVPDHLTALPAVTCTGEIRTKDVSGSHSYSDSLSESASVNGEGGVGAFKAKFSASTDFKSVQKGSNSYKNKYIEAASSCTTYKTLIDPNDLPKFTAGFEKAMKNLPAKFDENKYVEFIRAYGTHYMSTVYMGARVGVRYTMDSQAYQAMKSQSLNVKASAEASYGSIKGGASSETDTSHETADTFKSAVSDTASFSLGGIGLSTTSAPESLQKFQEAAQANPMPVKYDLKDIAELLPPAQKAAMRSSGYMAYCKSLQKAGRLTSCEEPLNPKPLSGCQYYISTPQGLTHTITNDKYPADKMLNSVVIANWKSTCTASNHGKTSSCSYDGPVMLPLPVKGSKYASCCYSCSEKTNGRRLLGHGFSNSCMASLYQKFPDGTRYDAYANSASYKGHTLLQTSTSVGDIPRTLHHTIIVDKAFMRCSSDPAVSLPVETKLTCDARGFSTAC